MSHHQPNVHSDGIHAHDELTVRGKSVFGVGEAVPGTIGPGTGASNTLTVLPALFPGVQLATTTPLAAMIPATPSVNYAWTSLVTPLNNTVCFGGASSDFMKLAPLFDTSKFTSVDITLSFSGIVTSTAVANKNVTLRLVDRTTDLLVIPPVTSASFHVPAASTTHVSGHMQQFTITNARALLDLAREAHLRFTAVGLLAGEAITIETGVVSVYLTNWTF
jgi:hypothetical protein